MKPRPLASSQSSQKGTKSLAPWVPLLYACEAPSGLSLNLHPFARSPMPGHARPCHALPCLAATPCHILHPIHSSINQPSPRPAWPPNLIARLRYTNTILPFPLLIPSHSQSHSRCRCTLSCTHPSDLDLGTGFGLITLVSSPCAQVLSSLRSRCPPVRPLYLICLFIDIELGIATDTRPSRPCFILPSSPNHHRLEAASLVDFKVPPKYRHLEPPPSFIPSHPRAHTRSLYETLRLSAAT